MDNITKISLRKFLDSNEIDVFDELENNQKLLYPTPPNSLNSDSIFNIDDFTNCPISQMLNPYNLNFPREFLLISSFSDKKKYSIPPKSSQAARKIWEDARIPSVECIYIIEMKLLDWAFKNARLEIIDTTIKSITWKSCSTSCTASWKTFLKWIICATTNK
jgi:hypothetical protein